MNQRTTTFSSLLAFLCLFIFGNSIQAQNFGTVASAVWLSDCNQSNFFNTSGTAINEIGPPANVFSNANLGFHTQNTGTLILRGAELRTFKNAGAANVCSARLYYRIYLQTAIPSAFNIIDLPLLNDCDTPAGQYPSGGSCQAGDQKWNRVIPGGVTSPYAPINLTSFTPGNYVLEVYYDIAGSSTSTTLCDETIVLNNGGANYKAFFSIQAPVLASNNPTTCNGTEGLITIGGLVAGTTYNITYTDDSNPVGPVDFVANGSGQVVISGLNAGIYSNFELLTNGCTTNLFTGIILSNPVFTPTFTKINPFCAGSTPPLLPLISNNGISGTWSPAIINNQSSGFYTFTPGGGQCGLPLIISVTVTPNITPTFSFGTTSSICAGGVVPSLPGISNNGISGVWNPSVVDNQNSGVYTFTPNPGPCTVPTSFTVTVTPNVTPTFNFGNSLTICEGQAVPALPALSANGITGTWTPAVANNMTSGNYSFTPVTGQCAVPTSFSITVLPNITPVFSFGTSSSICENGNVPTLPTTSDNGITGSWNPAIVSNQVSGIYTFTPTAGLCATTTTFNVTIAPNITPTFSFGTSLTICAGGTVPVLTSTSTNGFNGTWNPAVVDNQNSGTYTFTPEPGSCVTTTTFNVTVTPNITPTFSFGNAQTICNGSTAPVLPPISANGITGTWSPTVVSNQASDVYTFTPAAGLCAIPTTFSVTVMPNVTPLFSFGTSLTICANGIVPVLPTTSDNGITGAWNPAVVNNMASGNYIFTPTAGLCATLTTFAVTVIPNITPTFSFGTSISICEDGIVPTLPALSANGITGVWNPAIVDNQNSDVYTFTPTPGLCAITTTFTVTVAPNVIPTFSFGTSLSICAGGTVPALHPGSTNGITGTWNLATVDNQNSGVYTFTPTAGLCTTPATFTVTVTTNVIPVFNFGTSLSICAGDAIPILPTISSNGISGTWNPSVVSDQSSDTYTFTPATGSCALPASFSVTVTQNILPTFIFGTTLSACENASVPTLPAVSTNGITGTWSPAVIDNQNSAVYTFTPTFGQCALSTDLSVTINPIITPTFGFGTALTICSDDTPPVLPLTSGNNITGTWDPAVVNNQASAFYTFTPAAGQCAIPTIFTVTVTPSITPVFSFGTTLSFCTGGAVPTLPPSSTNGINGTWNPTTISNQASGVYTFTPSATPDQCIIPITLTVAIKPILTPQFSFGPSLTICAGGSVPVLPATSGNDINGVWNPATIDNQASGVYTFTTTPGQCATSSAKLTVTINPVPTSSDAGADTIVNDGDMIPASNFQGDPPGVNFIWTNSNAAIGLPASGTGNVPAFTATNRGNDPINGTITMTPVLNGCAGAEQNYTVTVKPLNKDVFVPNAFSPNGDGKNDVLFVYGNYIDKLEMRIFNQWGEQIELLNSTTRGWNGTHRGKPQPVGVYVYTLRAELSDGRTVKMKGSITLLR